MKIEEIQFVIVLYKQELQNSVSFRALSKCLETENERASLFVYDNSPDHQTVSEHYDEHFYEVEYIHDQLNSGLSVAYNRAGGFAKRTNKSWLFLLDQDTFFPDYSLRQYVEGIIKFPDIKLFAPVLRIQNGLIMSPCLYRYKWGKLTNSIRPGVQFFDYSVPVNSGICVNLAAFLLVGGYNEKVKIDGADFQFIEKFSKRYKSYLVLDLIFEQNFSFFDSDVDNVLFRYDLFIRDVGNFETESILDRILYHRIVAIRTIKVSIQMRSFKFLKRYIRYLFSE